uniref:C2H2-type domain-containing protein n=1 Tax=Timema monikensis TaxID=170555 RepID=A0A7R9EDM9_9NEOP|nr:unnamed protein product [Timema monikensis]
MFLSRATMFYAHDSIATAGHKSLSPTDDLNEDNISAADGSDSSSASTSPRASPVLTTDVLFPVALCEIVYKREQAAPHSDRSREDKDINDNGSRPKTKHKQQRYHIRKKRYLCSYCNLTFNRKETRNRHVFVHTGEKPYNCSECGAKFVQRGHLKRHVLIHRHEKPHACPDCPAQFRDKRNLNTHMLQHTGEKPFGCLLCDSRFSDRSNLRRHEAIHTEVSCELSVSTKEAMGLL